MKTREHLHKLNRDLVSDASWRQLETDAAFIEKVANKAKVMGYIKSITPSLLTLAGITAVGGALAYRGSKERVARYHQTIGDSYHALSGGFAHEPTKFHDRFSELAVISPTVASNPKMADKIIRDKLHTGFGLDDVHRLAAIEYHTAHSPKLENPTAVAKAKALGGLESALQMLGPSMVLQLATPQMTASLQSAMKTKAEQHKDLDKAIHAGMAQNEQVLNEHLARAKAAKAVYEANPSRENAVAYATAEGQARKVKQEVDKMNKEGSATQKVSDECLGRMLADAHVMVKSAAYSAPGALKAVGAVGKAFNLLKPGADVLSKYFQVMAVPMAVGLGIKAMHSIMQQRETAAMGRQADAVFAGLARSSDVIKGDLSIAKDAFDSLRSFAPALAIKPMIARTFVEHVVNSGGRMPTDTVQQLANTQTLISRLNEGTGGGFASALKEPMSLFGHSVKLPGQKKDRDDD